MKCFFKILTVLSFLVCIVCMEQVRGEDEYTFGVVPQFDSRTIHNIWQPILEKIEQKTNLDFQLVLSSSIPEFERVFTMGGYDFAYMNPYHMIVAHKKQGYLPLVRDVENRLHGIIVVRKDSTLTSVSELDQKTVAFPAPNALGASLIPRAEFKNRFQMEVKPRYVRSHTSVYLNVVLKQTVAGGGVQKTLSRQKPEIRDALKILYKTAGVAPHPVAVHPHVPKQDAQKVKKAFLSLGDDEIGKSLLQAVPIETIGPAKMEDYNPLKSMGLERFYEIE